MADIPLIAGARRIAVEDDNDAGTAHCRSGKPLIRTVHDGCRRAVRRARLTILPAMDVATGRPVRHLIFAAARAGGDL
jgi:hypothetical protein